MTRLSRGSRILEKAALDVSREIVPLQDHCRAEASQDVFFFLGKGSLCLLRGVPLRKRSSASLSQLASCFRVDLSPLLIMFASMARRSRHRQEVTDFWRPCVTNAEPRG